MILVYIDLKARSIFVAQAACRHIAATGYLMIITKLSDSIGWSHFVDLYSDVLLANCQI